MTEEKVRPQGVNLSGRFFRLMNNPAANGANLCGFMISGDGSVAFWLPLFRWLRCLNIGFIISGINYRVVLPNTRNFFAFSPTKHP